jgi:hypothetical protein
LSYYQEGFCSSKSSFSSYLFNFCYIQDFLNLISVWDSFLVFLLHTDWQQQDMKSKRERMRRTKYEKKLKFSFSMHVYRHYSVLYVYIYPSISIDTYSLRKESIAHKKRNFFSFLKFFLVIGRSSMNWWWWRRRRRRKYTQNSRETIQSVCVKFVTTSNWFC